ncbi:PTS system galactitol-specific IIC component [Trichococcus patagoniensis]|uniref:PTS system galactitol-specific IIC component n=1 Tax=Trichococcus patagoniensis TaxID=382641 RepID=A0A2T5IK41_9LACT|nr:PTS transporter subunit IIC [Trichococcus patagoniensis]PTQ84179.1 PTS system galactitol-specific IIC component [Trichococcus patagoniensis]
MDTLQSAISFVLNDLGAAVFVPLLMLLIGLSMKMKFAEAFHSALTLGIAFTGMSILINYMMASMGDAAQKLADNTGISLTAIDGGWPGMASISWAWPYAFLMFPLTIGINILMLLFNKTKTLNVDMWNVWNKIFTAVMVSYITGNVRWGFLAASIQIILELKAGDMWGPEVEKLTGISGVTVPHFVTLIATILFPIDELLKKIPFFNKPLDANILKIKIGILGENSVMGAIIGFLLGLAAGYGFAGALQLAIQAATALTLFPMVSKLFSQALTPISEAISDFMKKKFSGREVYIGLDWPVLAGRNELWVAVIITIPAFLITAIVLPGNNVLPFAGIINLSFVIGALLLTDANLSRMIFHGIFSGPLFLYAATFFAPYITRLANETGAATVAEGKLLSWSTIAGPDIRYLFCSAFSGSLINMILLIVWLGIFYTLYQSKKKYNATIGNDE